MPDLAEQRVALLAQDFPVGREPSPKEGDHLLVTAIGEFRANLAAREESKIKGCLEMGNRPVTEFPVVC